MMWIVFASQFLVGIQPVPGVNGRPSPATGLPSQHIVVEAHDANTAKQLTNAKYWPFYRVYDVRQIDDQKKISQIR